MITEQNILDGSILIVDDNQDVVLLLEKILSREGFSSVCGTSNAKEAFDLYVSLKPDLVILDINMPQLNGFQVMDQLKQFGVNDYLPVIVLTGQQDRETKLQALSAGAKDFLTKPLDRTEALTRIRNQMEIRLLHKKLRNQNEELEEKVRDRTKELNDTRLEIIRRLGRAAEYRDNETGYHIIRMSKMCALLAHHMGMTARETELLLNASPMHDIGKIGIPDRVLLKPVSLDAEEWKIMKTHTTIGAEILAGHDSELMVMAKSIALTHHEKWNGLGYPNGISGENIPLVGRITMVCDVFDALTSKRPYKQPWPVDRAMAELENASGKSFDPRLVHLFQQIRPEIQSIMENYKEPS